MEVSLNLLNKYVKIDDQDPKELDILYYQNHTYLKL